MTPRPSTRRDTTGSSRAIPGDSLRSSILVALGALVGAFAVWWNTSREPGVADGHVPPPSAAVAASASVAPTTRVAKVAPLPTPPPPPVIAYPAHGVAGRATDDPLTAYRKANVYPPTSRPLTRDQADLLHPNQRHETTRAADHGDGVTFLFTADRYFVIGDETLTATLEVWRNGRPLDVAITQAFATFVDPARHEERPVPLAFAPSGARLASVFAPANLQLARQSAITLNVEFDHGDGRQRAHFDVQYTPTAGIPARFTGSFRDSIENGSLVIHAGVDVTTPGPYLIDANLFDAADQPVAWTRFKGDLAAGTHDADLLFFGKVLVDAGARGPFHLGQLRGARFAPGRDPDLEQMPSYPDSYTTAAYPISAFSDAEYDSPDKQRMIDLLGNDHTHRGGAGGGGRAGGD